MVFSSLNFIFIFLPLFLFAYYVTPAAFRNNTLFAGSILFYAVGVIKQPYALFLLMVLTYLNYVFGIRLYQIHNPRKKRLFLTKVIFFDFLWLFLFKYSRHLFLPLGISFYTFQLTAYLFDIYYGRILPERDFVTFGTYISMFPKLISGPITPYEMLRRQLHSARRFLPENLAEGMKLFIRGLGLKAILANQFGSLWANVGTIGYESISTPLAWLGIYAYSFQIYFDFYGYSLMAAGLGRMLGFKLPINFMHPYLSTSMTEFWRRWHITLGQWFQTYIYIPLGGNRTGTCKWIRNLLVVWILTGIWHGTEFHFILWGFSLFVIVLTEKLLLKKLTDRYALAGHLYMAVLIPLSWMLFGISDPGSIEVYTRKLFPFFSADDAIIYVNDFWKNLNDFRFIIPAGFLFSTRLPVRFLKKIRGSVPEIFVYLAIFWASVYCIYVGSNDPFLYFRF